MYIQGWSEVPMRQPVTIMGSICSSNNNNSKAGLPPQDLGELLQQAEKVRYRARWQAQTRGES